MPEYVFCALLSSFAWPGSLQCAGSIRSQSSERNQNLINFGMCRNEGIGKNEIVEASVNGYPAPAV